LIALGGSAPTVRAQTALSASVTPTYVSQYMFRGQRLGGSSFQPWVEADAGDLAVGVWCSTPLANRVPGQSDPEIDPYGSYTISLGRTVSVAPGCTVYTYPQAPAGKGFYRSEVEPSLAVNWTSAGVRITPKAYYDAVEKGATYELNAAAALPLAALGTEADLTATVGDTQLRAAVNGAAPAVASRGGYWLLGAAVPVQLTPHFKLTAGWAYSAGTGSYLKQGSQPKVPNPAAAGRGIVTVSLGCTF
jgi:hypothetical protein